MIGKARKPGKRKGMHRGCAIVKARCGGEAPKITKGGDGGAAVPDCLLHRSSASHDRDNAKVVLCGMDVGKGLCGRERAVALRAFRLLLVATADPFDCAHAQRDEGGIYYLEQAWGDQPRPGLAGCRRRRYHPSQMLGGVAVDSAFDGLHARVQRLAADGLGAQRVGAVPTGLLAEMLDARLPTKTRLRDVLHQRTRVEMTAGELAAQRAGSALLGVFCDDDALCERRCAAEDAE